MTLEERYTKATTGYVNLVKTQQAADAGARAGVNAFDGAARGRFDNKVTAPDDQWQSEFKRNKEGSFRYGNPGQNDQVPGTSANVTDGQGGLSRFTAQAVKIAFTDAIGRSSLFNRFKAFKTASPVNWNGYNNFHQYYATNGKTFVDSLPDTDSFQLLGAKPRVTGAAKGPSPSGIGG